jgi:hypothetical protein
LLSPKFFPSRIPNQTSSTASLSSDLTLARTDPEYFSHHRKTSGVSIKVPSNSFKKVLLSHRAADMTSQWIAVSAERADLFLEGFASQTPQASE